MAKAIRIKDHLFVNMDNIVHFVIDDERVNIFTNVHPDVGMGYFLITSSPLPEDKYDMNLLVVPVNELHRIKRELAKFMQVEVA
ncbi:hypothetical protein [Vibrio sp. WXL210]|uniref:hypothetical protein n=1 Tax=Vibrio sp. WXL210 TaxID=3450709 RepID=UPI003EC83D2C